MLNPKFPLACPGQYIGCVNGQNVFLKMRIQRRTCARLFWEPWYSPLIYLLQSVWTSRAVELLVHPQIIIFQPLFIFTSFFLILDMLVWYTIIRVLYNTALSSCKLSTMKYKAILKIMLNARVKKIKIVKISKTD